MTKKIMPGAEPYFEINSKKGILFLHGFTGSPHEHRWIAKKFAKLGYSVSVPLLAGHGTSPRDLRHTKWGDWNNSAKQALFELKKHTSKILIVGLSMGGALTLHLASHYEVNGIAVMATPLFLKDWKLKLLPVIKHFLHYKPKYNGVDIKNPEQKIKAVHYNTQPVKSIEQLLQLFDHVKNDLPDIHVPTLLVYSTKDHVAPFCNKDYIKNNISSQDIRELVLENCFHVITLDEEREKVFNTLEIFIKDIIGEPE